MSFNIIRQDITKLKVDGIVNVANTDLQMGGGVCGAIFKAAGEKDLQDACNTLSPINVGQAVITSGFNLPTKYVIHTVRPVYSGGKQDEARLLSLAYKNSLELALEKQLESIAFPLISSGIYGYPKEEALDIGVATIKEFLKENEMKVSLVIYDKSAFKLSEKLLGPVKSYIDDKYVDARIERRNLPTELVFILDKSGSMTGLEKDTIGDYNSMLEKQRELEGECKITTVLFDYNYDLIHDRIDMEGIRPMTEKEYRTGGYTAC